MIECFPKNNFGVEDIYKSLEKRYRELEVNRSAHLELKLLDNFWTCVASSLKVHQALVYLISLQHVCQ